MLAAIIAAVTALEMIGLRKNDEAVFPIVVLT
jgi:hypothetical protein